MADGYSAEWFTPAPIVDAARAVLGSIDLDPASDPAANLVVRADRFYTRADDGLSQPWAGRVFLNPPGDQRGALARKFWCRLVDEYDADRVTSAIYVGFNIQQVRSFQRAGASASPLDFPICVPRERIRFVSPDDGVGARPRSDNFICLLPDMGELGRWQTLEFRERFGAFGDVANVRRFR